MMSVTSGLLRAQRGYTIVEMAIVLVVIGLLLGATLYPLSARLREERYAQARVQLDTIQEAITSYATRNKSNGFSYYLVEGDANRLVQPTKWGRLPAGRSYLPCPDVNGDGIEDRNFELAQLDISNRDLYGPSFAGIPDTESSFVFDLTLTVAGAGPEQQRRYFNPVFLSNTRERNFLMPELPAQDNGYPTGFCVKDRGTIPYATLGTPAADPWGNRFTYRVDPIFSSSVLGFGAETRANTFEPRLPLINPTLPLKGPAYDRREAISSYRPNILRTIFISDIEINNRAGEVCLNAECSEHFHQLATGAQSESNYYDGNQIFKNLEDGDLVSGGMAFMLISHGENGAGAVPHHDGLNLLGPGSPLLCIPPPEPANGPEDRNGPGDLCRAATSPDASSNHLVYALPRSDRPERYFDDEVRYMSDIDLIGHLLRKGVDLGPIWIPPLPSR